MRFLKAVVVMAVLLTVGPSHALGATATQPDPSWQVGGAADAVVRSIVFSGNTMYIGGRFNTVRPPGVPPGDTSRDVVRHNVAAFDRTTGNLLPWNPNANGEVFSLAVFGWTVYLGGAFTQVGSIPRARFAAVDVTRGIVNPNITVTAGATIYVIKRGPNGNLFLGGAFSKIDGQTRSRLAEITTTGALVSTWKPNVAQYYGDTRSCPPRCHPVVFTIDFSADGGTVYFGGHFGLVNGVHRNEAAAVAISDSSSCATAACVSAWNPSIFSPRNCPTCKQIETSRVYTLHVTTTRVYACGGYFRVNYTATQSAATTRYNVAAFNLTDGTVLPRSTFDAEDDGDTPGCDLRDNVLYLGGHFNYVGKACPCTPTNSATRHHVAAVDATTGALLPWNPGANSNHGVYTVTADRSSTSVGFGGYFTTFGGTYHQGIAKFGGPVSSTGFPLPAAGPALAATSTGPTYLFSRAPNRSVYYETTAGSGWSPAASLGGLIFDAPAAAAGGNGSAELFVRGIDNQLWARRLVSGSWTPWASAGGVLSSQPAAAASGRGRDDVFVRGVPDGLWHRALVNNRWTPWDYLGGRMIGGPGASSWAPGQLSVFVQGTDRRMWGKFYSTATRSWGSWTSFGGVLASAPAAVSAPRGAQPGTVMVFVTGTDGAVYQQRIINGRGGGWTSLGGVLSGGPAASSTGHGRYRLVGASPNGHLYERVFNGSWGPWTVLS